MIWRGILGWVWLTVMFSAAHANESRLLGTLQDCPTSADPRVALQTGLGGIGALRDQDESNYHGNDEDRSPTACVGVVSGTVEQVQNVQGFNPLQPQQVAQILAQGVQNNPVPTGLSHIGNYQVQCQPQAGNPHTAIDLLQGLHTVDVSEYLGTISIVGPLPFGTYEGPLLDDPINGPPILVSGVFEVAGIANVLAQANIQFFANNNQVQFAMNLRRGLGQLPGGQPSDWLCFGGQQ